MRATRMRRGWVASAVVEKDPGFFAALRMTRAPDLRQISLLFSHLARHTSPFNLLNKLFNRK